MSASNSLHTVNQHRTTPRRGVRVIEGRHRAMPLHPSLSGYARCVGRVGALAVALGVGAAIGSMPVAFADTTGSGGSTGSSSDGASSTGSTTHRGPRVRVPRLTIPPPPRRLVRRRVRGAADRVRDVPIVRRLPSRAVPHRAADPETPRLTIPPPPPRRLVRRRVRGAADRVLDDLTVRSPPRRAAHRVAAP